MPYPLSEMRPRPVSPLLKLSQTSHPAKAEMHVGAAILAVRNTTMYLLQDQVSPHTDDDAGATIGATSQSYKHILREVKRARPTESMIGTLTPRFQEAQAYLELIGNSVPNVSGPSYSMHQRLVQIGLGVKQVAARACDGVVKIEAERIVNQTASDNEIGVVLALTLKNHPNPVGGFDRALIVRLQDDGHNVQTNASFQNNAIDNTIDFWDTVINTRFGQAPMRSVDSNAGWNPKCI